MWPSRRKLSHRVHASEQMLAPVFLHLLVLLGFQNRATCSTVGHGMLPHHWPLTNEATHSPMETSEMVSSRNPLFFIS